MSKIPVQIRTRRIWPTDRTSSLKSQSTMSNFDMFYMTITKFNGVLLANIMKIKQNLNLGAFGPSRTFACFRSGLLRTSTSWSSWIFESLVSILIVIADVLFTVLEIWKSRTTRMSTSRGRPASDTVGSVLWENVTKLFFCNFCKNGHS